MVLFSLNVWLDFSLLACETMSAHSPSLPRSRCCPGSIEPFLRCFYKPHDQVLTSCDDVEEQEVDAFWLHEGFGKNTSLSLLLLNMMIWAQK